MSQLITGEKTPQQMKDMRECGKMLATIYDELKKSVTAGMSELDANDFVEPKGAKKHLLHATEQSLYAGIDAITGDGTRVGDISAGVEAVLKKAKLGIIRELVGHGVGLSMHMEPEIPNYGRRGTGPMLHAGDTIAIEPMASLGGEKIITDTDGWTISMKDGSLGAHFEHTVLITETGAEIITKL